MICLICHLKITRNLHLFFKMYKIYINMDKYIDTRRKCVVYLNPENEGGRMLRYNIKWNSIPFRKQ